MTQVAGTPSIVALILARLGSKRVPDRDIRPRNDVGRQKS